MHSSSLLTRRADGDHRADRTVAENQFYEDHPYLRGANHTSPFTVTLSLTKDAAH